MVSEKYRLVYYWDDYFADYRFELERSRHGSFNDPESIADGDAEWANRTAKHYDIELPKSYLEEQENK